MKVFVLLLVLVFVLIVVIIIGCVVMCDQESVGEYVDDVILIICVKGKFVVDLIVLVMFISVEMLKGVVQFFGFVKSSDECVMVEKLVCNILGVKGVKNDIVVCF